MRVAQNLWFIVASLVLSLLLMSCGRGGETNPTTGSDSKPESAKQANTASDPEVLKGKLLFAQLGCNTCHMNPTTGKDYPDLRGLYGKTIRLADDSTAKVDDAYLYESIKESNKRIVKGYKPAMPSFAHLKDDQVKALIAYIKSLKDEKPVFVKPESFVSE